jgi:HlyD family secretion protein
MQREAPSARVMWCWHDTCTPSASGALMPSDASGSEFVAGFRPNDPAPLAISPRVSGGLLSRRRVRWALILIAAACVAAVFFARNRTEPSRYITTRIERRTIIKEVEVTGQLDVIRRIEVPAPLPARLVEVLVREGDRVTEGQPLALLDGRALTIAARGARAGLDASSSKAAEALVELDAAHEALARIERLRSRDLASLSELEEARARASRAKAALATARADRSLARESLRSARLSESSSTIQAPMSGIVLQGPEVTGAAVSPEREALFVIGSALDTLRVVAEVAESEVSEVHPGQAARFTVPAHPGRSFAARVNSVGVAARRSAVAVRYRVELEAPNPSNLLLPGMTATATIAVARAENVLAARDGALRLIPDGAPDGNARVRVFRVDASGLQPIRISAGISDGVFTELESDPPGALGVGTELAVGLRTDDASRSTGPGIRLGNR